MLSRNQKDLTRDYPAIAAAIGQLAASQLVLDGELVAIDRSRNVVGAPIDNGYFNDYSIAITI